jgi:hypothetical protein
MFPVKRLSATLTAASTISMAMGLALVSFGGTGCVTQAAPAKKPAKACPYRRPRRVPRAKRYPVR